MQTLFALGPLILFVGGVILLWRTSIKRSAFFIIVTPFAIGLAILEMWFVFKIGVHWVVPGLENDWKQGATESIAVKTADDLAKNPGKIPLVQAVEGVAQFVAGGASAGGSAAIPPAQAPVAPAAGGGQVQPTPVSGGGGRSVIPTPAVPPTPSVQQAALAQAMAFTPPTSVNKEMATSLRAVLGQFLTANNFPAGPGNDGFPYAGATDKRAWFPAGVRCKEAFRYLTDWHSIRCWLGPQDNDHIVFSVDANGKFYDFGNTSFDGVSPWPVTMIQAFCAINASSWPTCPNAGASRPPAASPTAPPATSPMPSVATPTPAAPPPGGGAPPQGGGDGATLQPTPGVFDWAAQKKLHADLGKDCTGMTVGQPHATDTALICSKTCGWVYRLASRSECPQ